MPLSQIVSASIEDGAVAPVDLSSVAQYTGFKNRLINGAMLIDQRNAGGAVTPTINVYTYITDRWGIYVSQSSKLVSQQAAGVTLSGFNNALYIASSSAYSITSSDIFLLRQVIEGFNAADLLWGTASAHTVTLSFKVYSSLTGTFGGSLMNSAGDRSYPFSYSIPVANTWTTISLTIPGETTGTWLTTNGIGIRVHFGLGVGSTSSGTAGAWGTGNFFSSTGAVSVVGTNGALFYITGVQLEKGVTATSFDFRDYGRELMMCQRYYWKLPSGRTTVIISTGYSGTTNNAWLFLPNPVTMRTAPTVTSSGWEGTVPASVFGGAEFLSFNSTNYNTYIGGNTIVQASAEL
jgi:hypothetical protein